MTIPQAYDTDADLSSLPLIYLACSLTGIKSKTKRLLDAQVSAIQRAVEDVTVSNRPSGETWPVRTYAPIQHTAPWNGDALNPRQVYERNLIQVHSSDALIVLGQDGASAGVGQELEWAVTIGLPILYLAPTTEISRQIQGTPGNLTIISYDQNQELEAAVRNFVRLSRPRLVDGPRRREARGIRFEVLTKQLRSAWERSTNRTTVAAECLVTIEYLDVMLSRATLVAALPSHTLISVARSLSTPLAPAITERQPMLPVPATRALYAAAAEDGWSDKTITHLVVRGVASLQVDPATDLNTLDAWRELQKRI